MTEPGKKPDALAEIAEALEFYAEPKNHSTTSTGFAAQYDPVPPAVKIDRGSKARSALSLLPRLRAVVEHGNALIADTDVSLGDPDLGELFRIPRERLVALSAALASLEVPNE